VKNVAYVMNNKRKRNRLGNHVGVYVSALVILVMKIGIGIMMISPLILKKAL